MTDEITPGNRCTSTSMLETFACVGFGRNTGDVLPLNQRLFLCIMSAPTLETVWSLNEAGIELAGKGGRYAKGKPNKITLVTRSWQTVIGCGLRNLYSFLLSQKLMLK